MSEMSEWASTGLAFFALLVPLSAAGSCSCDGIEKQLTEEISPTYIFEYAAGTVCFMVSSAFLAKWKTLDLKLFIPLSNPNNGK